MKPLLFLLIVVTQISLCFSLCCGQDVAPKQPFAASNEAIVRFKELTAKHNSQLDQYFASRPANDQDSRRWLIEHHPFHTMVDDFLALEQDARGTDVGFSCLFHLVNAGASISDGDLPAAKGKAAALVLLGEHYHSYPDVDTTFSRLFFGNGRTESKLFLRTLIDHSSREDVRANAMYMLANHLAYEANLPAIYDSLLTVVDRTDPAHEPQVKFLEAGKEDLKTVSVEQNRLESLALVQEIEREYAEILMPPKANGLTPAIITVTRGEIDGITQSRRARIVDQLAAIQFELRYGIGRSAPPIEGRDATGKSMHLADFQGNVVVLMFSFKGCGPCEAMYPDNRRLIKKLAAEPFVFVGVQRDDTIDTVLESLESGAITWRVWWEGEDRRISTQWNIKGWPTIFVLDRDGVIRYQDVIGKDLERAVRTLLDENRK